MNVRFPLYLLLFTALALGSCNVTKHLDEAKGERLLVKNTLEIKAEKRLGIGERTPIQYELAPYFKQQPNRKSFYFFYTRLWLYYKFKHKSGRNARWIMKKVAEAPTIYNPTLTSRTALNFENQMRQRGYLNADCSYVVDTLGKHKISVRYTLTLKQLYRIEQVAYASRDTQVLQVLRLTENESKLKPNTPLDGALFDAEKIRITNELKNRGYAFFTPNFVEFTGDTSNYKTKVSVRILTPGDTVMHKVYKIGNIAVFYSLVPDLTSIRSDTVLNGIYFASSESKFSIKPERLLKYIAMQQEWPYQQFEFDNTARNLNALGVFKFVSIKPQQDTIQPDKINVAISFTPNKRFTPSLDFDFNYRNSVTGGLIGLSSGAGLRNANAFRGAEQWQSNVQYNVAFDITRPSRLLFSQEFKFQNDLLLPRFFDYFGFWKAMSRRPRVYKQNKSESLYQRLVHEGKSRISLRYNYISQTDFYRYNLLNASFGYDIQTDQEHQYTFNHIGIDILRPKFEPAFQSRVSEFLRRSFDRQLFTGFILRTFSYNFASKANRFGERWQMRFNSELSGLEEYLLNQLYALPFGYKVWRIGDLDFAKYLRLEIDGVYSREFRKDLIGALRVGSGVVAPFGDSKVAPYVKQFFVGGPSSLRAWRIRELGPGAYHAGADAQNQRPFFQAGDFRFEFNGELRFPLFLWIKGAVFLDGGNVWSLRKEESRPGSQLKLDSYKNIAVGTGFGVRADLGFFILRFDTGLKLKYATKVNGSYWVSQPWVLRKELLAYNLAVGYPF